MKIFLIDQILFLLIEIGVIIGIAIMAPPSFAFVFDTIFIFVTCYNSHRILLLPIDLLIGAKTHVVYFSGQSNIEKCDFFSKKYICEWKFHWSLNGENHKIFLVLFNTFSEADIKNIIKPEKEKRIKIEYYRFSKILVKWSHEL